MVLFKELYIDKEAQNLIVKASVREESYFTNVYINRIYIHTDETEGTSQDPVYDYTFTDDLKDIEVTINKNEILCDIEKNLLFIHIETKGNPSSNIPCGMDVTDVIGVTFYKGAFYNTAMQYLKEINNHCSIPQEFIDFILKYKGLNISIESGHYQQAIKYYQKWFKKFGCNKIKISNCGCHG